MDMENKALSGSGLKVPATETAESTMKILFLGDQRLIGYTQIFRNIFTTKFDFQFTNSADSFSLVTLLSSKLMSRKYNFIVLFGLLDDMLTLNLPLNFHLIQDRKERLAVQRRCHAYGWTYVSELTSSCLMDRWCHLVRSVSHFITSASSIDDGYRPKILITLPDIADLVQLNRVEGYLIEEYKRVYINSIINAQCALLNFKQLFQDFIVEHSFSQFCSVLCLRELIPKSLLEHEVSQQNNKHFIKYPRANLTLYKDGWLPRSYGPLSYAFTRYLADHLNLSLPDDFPDWTWINKVSNFQRRSRIHLNYRFAQGNQSVKRRSCVRRLHNHKDRLQDVRLSDAMAYIGEQERQVSRITSCDDTLDNNLNDIENLEFDDDIVIDDYLLSPLTNEEMQLL